MKFFFKVFLSTLLSFFIFFLCISGIVFFLIFKKFPEKNKIIKKTKSVLQFKKDFSIVEGINELNPELYSIYSKNIRLSNIIEAIKKSKNDSNIKGISWELENLSGGLSQLKDLHDALYDFKKSGKFIYAYGQNFSQKSYYIASVADAIFLNPIGSIDIKGLGAEKFFYKKFFKKLGVEFNIFKEGKYKSAIEPYTQNKMSKEDYQQTKELLNSLWRTLSKDFSKSRKIKIEKINIITNKLLGSNSESAQKNHLSDKIIHYDEFIKFIEQKLKLSKEESINFIPITDYIKENKKKSNNKIAVLYASGSLIKGNSNKNIQDDYYLKLIDEIKKENSIKAVIIRINSRGGDALVSEKLQRALLKLKEKKLLIASLSDYAASGGYYIATAANYIFASPLSITGSIGAFGLIPNLKNLSKKIGFTLDKVETHKNSLGISSIGELSEDYKKIFHKNIYNIYKIFIKRVSNSRKIPIKEIEKIAKGRVWSGKDALNKKLIDYIGNLNEAIKFAAKKSKINDYTIVDFPKKDSWTEILKNIYNSNFTTNSNIYWEKFITKNYPEFFQEIYTLLFSSPLQMKFPFKIIF